MKRLAMLLPLALFVYVYAHEAEVVYVPWHPLSCVKALDYTVGYETPAVRKVPRPLLPQQ